MGSITKELKSIPGMVLGLVFALIVTFFILNFLQTRAPAPLNGAAGWAFAHATGDAYGGHPTAPAMALSPYTFNSNVGPLL